MDLCYAQPFALRRYPRTQVSPLCHTQTLVTRRARGRRCAQSTPLQACAKPEDALKDSPMAEAIRSVVRDTDYRSKDYGRCVACDEPVVIPGLSHSLCANCGWVKRPDPVVEGGNTASSSEVPEVETSGHHD
jgi:hypothetical protein